MQTHWKVYGACPPSLSISPSLSLSLSLSLSDLPSTTRIVHSEWVLEEVIPKFTIKAWLPCQAIRRHPVEKPWPLLVLYAKGSQSLRYHWKVGWMAISLQGLYSTASTFRLNLTSSQRIYPTLQFARTAIWNATTMFVKWAPDHHD
jgi:hypothetical protein